MIERTPQEIADFFQCYVAQDENGLWYINGCKPELKIEEGYWKPQRTPDDFEINIFSILVSAPADHDWTHLYEPNYQKEADSDNKPDSYYQDSPKVDNKPDHLGEVYTHKEYQLVYSDTPAGLSAAVTKLIGRGWSLYGSPFAMPYGAEFYHYQAMVRGV